MDEIDIAWASGLIEGEGSFTIGPTSQYIKISVNMTDYDVLERLNRIFPGKIYKTRKRRDHHKDSWVWVGKHTYLSLLIPQLCSRRRAKIAELQRISDERVKASQNKRNIIREKHDLVIELRNKGLTCQRIADEVGLDRSTVARIIRKRESEHYENDR